MIVSGEEQSNSDIHIHVSILPQTPLPSRLPHNIEQSSTCCKVAPCWLSISNIAVCTCPSSSSFKSLYTFSFWSNHFALSYSPGVKGSWCLSWYWPWQAKISARLIPQKWTSTLTCKGNRATRQSSTCLWRQSSFSYTVIFTECLLYARYWTKYWCTITRQNGHGAKGTVQKSDINQTIRRVYVLNYNSYTKC